jgi:hypothetical protein
LACQQRSRPIIAPSIIGLIPFPLKRRAVDAATFRRGRTFRTSRGAGEKGVRRRQVRP